MHRIVFGTVATALVSLCGVSAMAFAQPAVPGVAPVGARAHVSRGTGYYPDPSRLEGGYKDKRGAKLLTLQAYLEGKAPFVSVAMDSKNGLVYGTRLRILELEKKYGRVIEFHVVDTGGAFKGKGMSRIDVCTANERASLDPTINGKLTLVLQGVSRGGQRGADDSQVEHQSHVEADDARDGDVELDVDDLREADEVDDGEGDEETQAASRSAR